MSRTRRWTVAFVFLSAVLPLCALAAKDPCYTLSGAGALGKHEALYACTYVHCELAQPAVLALGVPGPYKVWVNAAEVGREPAAGGRLAADTSRVPAQLREGPNFILLKLCGPGKPAFYCKFLGLDGKPMLGVTPRQPLRADEEAGALTWAFICPFSCYADACVLDTRFLPERELAGPPRDASSLCRWQPMVPGRPKPPAELVNGSFEFVDADGQPYGWRATVGSAQTSPDAIDRARSLVLPSSERPVSREVMSYPFAVNPRKAARASLRFKLPDTEAGHPARSVALSVWVQWLDEQRRVVGAEPVCVVASSDSDSGEWRTASRLLRLPFEAACARVQLRTWQNRRSVLVDHVAFQAEAEGE